jgi:voltage-gated potassium channel
LVIEGDATDDECLRQAGLEYARGLVAAIGTDADNVFLALTARVMNPKVLIVARANTEESINKLKRAGADHVVTPHGIGGRKMATLLLNPLVSDYLDVVTGNGEVSFRLEEFALNETCAAQGRSIKELDIRSRTGATILAVRRGVTGSFDTNPSPDTVLAKDDVLIAIGTRDEVASLEEIFGCRLSPRERTAFDVNE